MVRRGSDEELLAGVLQARIERWLELEGVFRGTFVTTARRQAR